MAKKKKHKKRIKKDNIKSIDFESLFFSVRNHFFFTLMKTWKEISPRSRFGMESGKKTSGITKLKKKKKKVFSSQEKKKQVNFRTKEKFLFNSPQKDL